MTKRKAYKLFRIRKDGSLGTLFINRKQRIPVRVWLKAEDHPTKGFAHRPGWHCSEEPIAPHLSSKGRTWYEVEIKNYYEFDRPKYQGGRWLISEEIKIVKEI